MTNLVDFLRARLDEDERIARAASGSTVVGEPGNWQPSPGGDEWEACAGDIEEELLVALRPGLPRPPEVMSGYWGAWVSNDPTHDPAAGSAMPALTHAARHDPARVLAEVSAKRQQIDEHRPSRPPYMPHHTRGCSTCTTAQAWDDLANEANCRTLRLLALPYVAHPEYREEWKP